MKKLVVIICLFAFFAIQSCTERGSEEKAPHTEELIFESFDGIKVSRLFNVKVIKGDKYKVTASVPERYADGLSIEIDSENNLVVSMTYDVKNTKRRDVFEAEITCPSFNRIIAEDLCKINVISEFSAENMELRAISLSEISFKEQLMVENNCKINAENMSKIVVSGTVSSLEIDADNMANVDCSMMSAKNVKASARSMSNITVSADEKFELEASNMSGIKYSGNGEVIRTVSESMSTIKKR